MSCTIYLLRHGIAAPASRGTNDSQRSLTAEGARRMARGAQGLKRLGIVPDVVLSSPLSRAQETAEIVARALAPDLQVQIYPALAPGHAPTEVLSGLRAHAEATHLVLVGHQPDLGALASHLLTGSSGVAPLPFKKGGVAAFAVAVLPPRRHAVLKWFLTPKQLRAIGRRRATPRAR